MRRSSALAPLSRDHHGALVLAARLRRAAPGGEQEAARAFAAYMGSEGLGHFRIEERLLLPAVPDEEAGAALVSAVLEDHHALRDAAEQAAAGVVPAVEEIHRIGRRLADHVRLEERRLFPFLESRLSEPELKALGELVLAAEESR